MGILTHAQLSAKPLPWANFYLRSLARFNKLCTILCLVFHQSSMWCPPRALAASGGCQDPREAGMGRELFNGTGSFMGVEGGLSVVFSCFCSHTAPHYQFFNAVLSGWGKAAFADDIGLSIIFFLGIQNVLMTESSLLIYYIRNKAYCSGFWAGQN